MLTGRASDRGQVRIMRHDQDRGVAGTVDLPRKSARPTAAARHCARLGLAAAGSGRGRDDQGYHRRQGVTGAFVSRFLRLAYLGPEGKEPDLGD